jgi:hypothetical protein
LQTSLESGCNYFDGPVNYGSFAARSFRHKSLNVINKVEPRTGISAEGRRTQDRENGAGRLLDGRHTFDDWGTPKSPTYKPPFKFTGTLKKVTVEVM